MKWTKKDDKLLLRILEESQTREDFSLRVTREFTAVTERAAARRLLRLGMGLDNAFRRKAEISNERRRRDDVEKFVAVARKGMTLEQLCDQMDLSPRRVREMVDAARRKGYALELKEGHVGQVPSKPSTDVKRIVAQPGEESIFAVVSDIHVGSKYHLREYLHDFLRKAHAQGVRTVFVPGDILDGVYSHSRYEQTHHGFHEQANDAPNAFPQLEGLRYVGITGNHDETFESQIGLSVVASLPAVFRDHGRKDFEMIGARGAYVRFAPKGGRGVLIEMWHPRKSPAYAVSYHLQKHVEEYAVGAKPDFLYAGHWHQQCYVERRGVHCFSSGTFQGGQSAFSKSIGGAPSIGGWVVRFTQTPNGTVRDVRPSWTSYYENETIREIGLG